MSIRFCRNCQRETEFTNGHCPQCLFTHDTCCTCGAKSTKEPDGLGNEYIVLPCDCEFEIFSEDWQNEQLNDSPTELPPKAYYDSTEYSFSDNEEFQIHCWNCKKPTIDPKIASKDTVKIFGYICPKCSSSIRDDPKMLTSIAKRLGLSPNEERFKYLKEMVDDLKKLPK